MASDGGNRGKRVGDDLVRGRDGLRFGPWWVRWAFPIVGFCALIWFLIRVLPKPSRATYPCQQVAFPLASSFVVWIAGALASLVALGKAQRYLHCSRYTAAGLLVGVAVSCLWVVASLQERPPAMADPPVANHPLGEAKGLHPGRVAWVFEPGVTDWDGGTGDGNWWFEHIDDELARGMMSRAIRGYAGVDDDAAAWNSVFRHFNGEKGKGDVGYSPGETITIKINLVACFAQENRVDANYDKTNPWKDNIDNPPELIYGLLEQLVHVVGVDQADIWIGDPTCHFPNYMYEPLHADFPDVHYWDNRGTLGRTRAEFGTERFHWSKPGTDSNRADVVPLAFSEAEYVINFAILKSHNGGGITVCGKNHYGSMLRLPTGPYRDADGVWRGAPSNPSYYNFHDDLPFVQDTPSSYRNRVDFMAHDHIGGKTFLYLIDGIIAGRDWRGVPEPWTLPPFDQTDGWPSSLFLSMDPVAIDSVALDFLREQWPEHANMSGVTDHLIEAALAHDPPSGTFYDPNHAGNAERANSLGVYESWNNPLEKRYTRDLDPENGTGIELLDIGDDSAVIARAYGVPTVDGQVDGSWSRTMWRLFPHVIDPLGGALPDEEDLAARWKVLWDNQHLYVLVEVTDDVLIHSSEHDERYRDDDSVSIFIDADLSRGAGADAPNYDGVNDFELGFRWGDPAVRVGEHSVIDTTGISFSLIETDAGYRLEAAVPWTTLRARPEALPPVGDGTQVGLDVQVSDNDQPGDSAPDTRVAWSSEFDDTSDDIRRLAIVGLSLPPTGEIEPPTAFIRGDANGDGQLDISDPVRMLLVLFAGAPAGDCDDSRDANDDGATNITDAMVVLQHLFQGGADLPLPYPLPGADPTPDDLECSRVR